MKLLVIVHPNSKKPRIEKDLFGEFHIYVSAPPQDGKANKAVTEALASYLHVSKSSITLLRGTASKHKLYEINK